MNHYTDINALPQILVENFIKDKEICLWATNIDYLNDRSEGEIGKKVIHELNQKNPDIQLNDISNDIFVISFSRAEDSLPMWSMYGANGSGIMLKFDFIKSNYRNYNMTQCTYKDAKEVIDENQETINLLRGPAIRIGSSGHDGIVPSNEQNSIKSSFISELSLAIRIAPKDKAFEHEKESRFFFNSPITSVKYRVRNNLLVPYIEYYMPKRVLKEIWIGPTNEVERAKKSIAMLLKTRGISDVAIKVSNIPYRG